MRDTERLYLLSAWQDATASYEGHIMPQSAGAG